MSRCTLLTIIPGHCQRCSTPLPKYRRRWCSDACGWWWMENHNWNFTRPAALRRDKGCVKCGSRENMEVNHIVPRNGRGYGVGCHNHLDGVETLCRKCHVVVTKAQRAERLGIKPKPPQGRLL